MAAIGDRIRHFRMLADVTQTELARQIGVSKQTLYKYENNIITNVPSDKIEAIASFLHIAPSDIMGWENDARHNIALTNDEIYLVRAYRSADEDHKRLARLALNMEEKEKTALA